MKKRVGIKSAISRLSEGRWARCTLWLSAQYENESSDSLERVDSFLHQRKLKCGVIKKDAHDWALIQPLLVPFKESPKLVGKLKVVIALDANKDSDNVGLLTKTLKAINDQNYPLAAPPMVYITLKKISDTDKVAEISRAFKEVNKNVFLCFGNRDAVRNYCSYATVIRVGPRDDPAVDFFMATCGVSVLHKNTVDGVLAELHHDTFLSELRRHNDLLRLITHVDDNVFLELAAFLTDIPLLAYGETDKVHKQIVRAIYDYSFSRLAKDQSEIFDFCGMRFLSWAPSLYSGSCVTTDSSGAVVPEAGALTFESISCSDLFPKDSNGLSDPFVVIQKADVKGQEWKTEVIHKELNPQWQDVNITVPDFEGEIWVKVSELLAEMPKSSEHLERTFRLQPKRKDKGKTAKSDKGDKTPEKTSKTTTPREGSADDISKSDSKHITIRDSRANDQGGLKASRDAEVSKSKKLKDSKRENDLLISRNKRKSVEIPKEDKESSTGSDQISSTTPMKDSKGMLMSPRSDAEKDTPRSLNKKLIKALGGVDNEEITGTISFSLSWESEVDKKRGEAVPLHFGIPLTESLKNAKLAGQEHIVLKICKYLEHYGTQQVGLFRIPGVTTAMKKMQSIVDAGEVISLDDFKTLDVAAFIKLYLRSLPDCLFLADNWRYLESVKAAKKETGEYDEDSGWNDVEFIRRICNIYLPAENLAIFKAILHCLTEIAACKDANKMSSDNLATCLAPTVLISPSITNDTEFLKRSQLANKVFAFMIDWAWDIFDFQAAAKVLEGSDDEDTISDF